MNPSRQDAFLLAAVIAVGSVAIAHADGPAAAPPPGDLSALKPAALSERHAADGRLVLGVGRIEGTLPAGWAALTIAGQTTYRSPDMQQQLRVFAYVADAPLSAEQQDRALTALIEVSKQAEQVIGKFATLTQSAPKAGRAAWGPQGGFYTVGPLTRVSLHYATVSEREALMFQLDGNGDTHPARPALEIVQSLHPAP